MSSTSASKSNPKDNPPKEKEQEQVQYTQEQLDAIVADTSKAIEDRMLSKMEELRKADMSAMVEAMKAMAPHVLRQSDPGRPMGTNYTVPKERRLESPVVFFAPQMGKILEAYVAPDGETKFPPNGGSMVMFNDGMINNVMPDGTEIRCRLLKTSDKAMKEWVEGHPEYGMRVFCRVVSTTMSDQAYMNVVGARMLERYKSMDFPALTREAARLGVQVVDDPQTLRTEIAAASARQQLKAESDRRAASANQLGKLAAMGVASQV